MTCRDDYHLYGERTGFQKYMLDYMTKELDFTYDMINPPDNEWGRIYKGNWTGMIQALVTGEADITFTQVLSDTRIQVKLFSVFCYFNGIFNLP